MHKRLYFIFTLILLQHISFSQSLPDEKKLGLLISHGSQYIGSINILGNHLPYTYNINSIAYQYQTVVGKNKMHDPVKIHVHYLVQPHIGISSYSYHYGELMQRGLELGVNAGLLVKTRLLAENLSAYMGGTTGPFYVSGLPDRQRAGFIFCDTGFMGMNVKVFPHLFLDARVSFRHWSNAGLKHPNAGINTFTTNGGILYSL